MMRRHNQDGFSLIEMLVSITVLLLAMAGLSSLLIQNARVNKSQQMTVEVQSNARNCLSMIVQRLRSAGWDPLNQGTFTPVVLDQDLSDGIDELEVFADLDMDGLTDSDDEQVLIRHVGNQVVWRRTNDTSDPFIVLAANISNDANGDGVPEQMFVPDLTPDPTRIRVTITAQSPVPDPTSGEFIRYTVSSDVALRKAL
jgi:prepilin-type N-terminal cleavage/methylation domain-containing protein